MLPLTSFNHSGFGFLGAKVEHSCAVIFPSLRFYEKSLHLSLFRQCIEDVKLVIQMITAKRNSMKYFLTE